MKRYRVHSSVRPSVCRGMGPQQQTRCCRFAAVGPAGRRQRSIAVSADVRRELNTDLLLCLCCICCYSGCWYMPHCGSEALARWCDVKWLRVWRSQRGQSAGRSLRQRAPSTGLDATTHRRAGAQRSSAVRYLAHPTGPLSHRIHIVLFRIQDIIGIIWLVELSSTLQCIHKVTWRHRMPFCRYDMTTCGVDGRRFIALFK